MRLMTPRLRQARPSGLFAVMCLVFVMVNGTSCRSANLYQSWGDNLNRMAAAPVVEGRGFTVDDVSMMLGSPPSRREPVAGPPWVTTGLLFDDRKPEAPVTVAFVLPGSSAAHVGLRRGDVVIAVDGEPTPTVAALLTMMRSSPMTSGAQRKLTTQRGEFTATAGEHQIEQCYWDLGAGGVAASSSGAFVNAYGGAASAQGSAYQRFFRATCRFKGGVLNQASSNWQF